MMEKTVLCCRVSIATKILRQRQLTSEYATDRLGEPEDIEISVESSRNGYRELMDAIERGVISLKVFRISRSVRDFSAMDQSGIHALGITYSTSGIDVHKRQVQFAVLDDEDKVTEEVRVGDADLDEVAHAGSSAALEAESVSSRRVHREAHGLCCD